MKGRKRVTLHLTQLDYQAIQAALTQYHATTQTPFHAITAERMRRRIYLEWWGTK